MKKILVIDDDTYMCNLLVNYLDQKGYQTEGTFSGNTAKKLIENQDFDLIICDYRLPDSDGYDLLQFTKRLKPLVPVIIITAYAEINIAVKLIKAGAFDYVTKPVQHEEILLLIKKAFESKNIHNSEANFQDDFITGKSEKMKIVMQHVQAVAPTDISVLIEGETGSGKEYIARAIHAASKRSKKPFVALDCGALPKEIANSELFGHIKGAFTGAINDKKGCFEQAKGGTLFLDEIGNLTYDNQVKLLRALQERVISRVGDNKVIKVDVRIIVASNENLTDIMKSGNFREDLYHRINGFKIDLPPLRQRKEDIPEFTRLFISKANIAFNKNISGINDEVKKIFIGYHWHGNIRELQNVINRSVLLCRSDTITPDLLPDEIKRLRFKDYEGNENSNENANIPELKEATLSTEKEIITNALEETNFNKSKAAQMLNIDRKTLYNKIKLYDIEVSKKVN